MRVAHLVLRVWGGDSAVANKEGERETSLDRVFLLPSGVVPITERSILKRETESTAC